MASHRETQYLRSFGEPHVRTNQIRFIDNA